METKDPDDLTPGASFFFFYLVPLWITDRANTTKSLPSPVAPEKEEEKRNTEEERLELMNMLQCDSGSRGNPRGGEGSLDM